MAMPAKSMINQYAEGNLLAATIIAADPVKYPGGAQEWADLILTRAAEVDERPGPLFRHRPTSSHLNRGGSGKWSATETDQKSL